MAPPASEAAARVSTLRSLTPEGFSVGFSGDWHAAEALIAGGDAWYSVLAGLFPAPAVAIHRAATSGDLEEARRLSNDLAPLWTVMRSHSGLRTMYAAARVTGISHAPPPRPILALGPLAEKEVVVALDAVRPYLGGH